MNKLPERINVMKLVTYDVQQVAESICDMDKEMSMDTITIEDILDYVQDWVHEDFDGDNNLIWQDENGNDL